MCNVISASSTETSIQLDYEIISGLENYRLNSPRKLLPSTYVKNFFMLLDLKLLTGTISYIASQAIVQESIYRQ